MASEDWFLRLDPYNFNSEDEFFEFVQNKERKNNDKRNDIRNCGKSNSSIR